MTDTVSRIAPDGLPTPHRYWAIVAVSLATITTVMDNTIGNIALPSITRELQISSAASVWVINAYQIAVIALLLPLAALGESIGFRRVSLWGLTIFAIGALASGWAHSLLALSLARVFQGVGAAAVLSVSGALLRFTYPHAMLGRAVSINAMVIAVAAASGPTLASAILSVGDWRWLFRFTAPLAFTALTLGLFVLPQSHPVARRMNRTSIILNVATFALLIAGVQSFMSGRNTLIAGVAAAMGLVAAVFLVQREMTEKLPLLPLDLLRSRIFSLSVATSMGCFVAQTLAFISLPFSFQNRMGYSAVQTGLLMTPWFVAVAVVAPFAGRLADRYTAGSMATLGMLVLSAGMAFLSLLTASASVSDIAWRMGTCGIGFALFQAPNNRAVLGGAPRSRSGAASGMLSMARYSGAVTGAVVATSCLRASSVYGTTIALAVASVIALAAAGLSAMRLIESSPSD